MGTLGSRPVTKLGLALFQSGVLYKPDSFAKRIINMTRTSEGTLETFPGAGRYEPKVTSGLSGGNFNYPISGIAHVETFAGANQVTVLRVGTELVRHQGWTRTFATLKTGLTYDPTQPFVDVCLPINGCVVWCNGNDRPLVVDCRTDGRLVVPLGFNSAPAAPTVWGPSPGSYNGNTLGSGTLPGVGSGVYAPNAVGYTVPGNLGTVSQYNGEDGAILDSAYGYAVQWEDILGNLSPLSPLSNLGTIQAQSCGYVSPSSGTYVRKNKLDMMLRGLAVRGIEIGEDHVKAIRLYRTTDTLHSDGKLHLRARIEGRQRFTYPDGMSDGALLAGDVPVPITPVVPFKVACEYQGRLVIGNLSNSPGEVRWSQPGAIGTFEETAWVVPDAGGAQITGLISYGGYLYMFTESSVFRLNLDAEGARPEPVSRTYGTVSPASVQVLPDGRLAWLSRRTVVVHDGSTVKDIGIQIQDRLRNLNMSAVGRAAGTVNPQTGVYLLALPIDADQNYVTLGYDIRVGGWHEYDLGTSTTYQGVTALHAMAGPSGYVLTGLGYQLSYLGPFNLCVWGYPDVSTFASQITSVYETTILRMDELGLQTFQVREILIGFIETDSKTNEPSLSVRVFPTDRQTNANPNAITTTNEDGSYIDYTAELVGQDFEDTWRLGNVTLGGDEAYYRVGAIRWRRVLVDVGTTVGFSFRLTVEAGRRINLFGIGIIAQPNGEEASRVPGPNRGDTEAT